MRPGWVHYALWAAQLLLAALFGMVGALKLATPAAEMPVALTRFIGLSEFLGALGMVLPAGLRTLPWLTPAAGAGLLTIMLLAMSVHIAQGDGVGPVIVNLALGGLAAFVLYGRWKLAPIAPRG